MKTFRTSLLFLFVFKLLPVFAQVEIEMDKAVYTARPGDTVSVVLSFSEAVPNGLEAYFIRINHPENLVESALIQVVPELDFNTFDPPAARTVHTTGAQVRGFTEFGEALYSGTDFVIFEMTISATAPLGNHPLTLSIPQPNSFINGLSEVIDDSLILGASTLTVVPYFDENDNTVPDDWELQFYPAIEDVPPSVEIQGKTVTIRDMYVAGLDPTSDVLPVFSGFVSIDTVEGRLYDIYHSTDLTDADGWGEEPITTFTGDGTTQSLPAPEPGFYRFEVRLPPEE